MIKKNDRVEIFYLFVQYKESLDLKNQLSKQLNSLLEQSDDQIEKIRDDLRHKRDEEKRRIDLCRDVEQQIGALEEQLNSIDINAEEQEDLQVF